MAKTSKKQQAVDRTRLTWVLAVLVAAMTIGTTLLGVLEPEHALSAQAKYLAATYNTDRSSQIAQTQTPISSERWNTVVIHRIGSDLRLPCLNGDPKRPAPPVHFAITPEAATLVTTQWESQKDIRGHAGQIHIGIQLAAGQTGATYEQAQALVALIRDLQARCSIPTHKVYLHSQLSERACLPDPLDGYLWRKALLP
jgi:hypothetical protein